MFKIVEQSPTGSNFKMNFVQCVTCNVPVGVVDYYDNNNLIRRVEVKVDHLETSLVNLESKLNQLINVMRSR